MKFLGFADKYVEHGAPAELMKDQGLTREGIVKSIKDFLKEAEFKNEPKSAISKK